MEHPILGRGCKPRPTLGGPLIPTPRSIAKHTPERCVPPPLQIARYEIPKGAVGTSASARKLPTLISLYPRVLQHPKCAGMAVVENSDAIYGRVAARALDGITGCEIQNLTDGIITGELFLFYPVTTSDLALAPTHVLVAPRGGRLPDALFPIHECFVQASCMYPPSFPPTDKFSTYCMVADSVACVADWPLPSPGTFNALRTFLYNKDAQELYDYLAPINRARWAVSFKKVDRQVAIIYGVWRNACFMGVVDMSLYMAIDRAWEVVYAVREGFLGHCSSDYVVL